jgi:CRP/FNR family transcriptional regulator, cyclic AMP receptor protein
MKSLNDEVAMLRNVQFFSSLETGKLKLLAYASQKMGFEDGDIVFRRGATEGDAYFILEGEADVLADTSSGQVVVAQLPRYALFGEISAFCDVPRTATIRARGNMVALRIPKEYLLDMIQQSPSVALQIIRVLAQRVANTTVDLAAALSANARTSAQNGAPTAPN